MHRYVSLSFFSLIVVLMEWWSAGSPARSSEASVSGSRAKSTGGGLDASIVRPPPLEGGHMSAQSRPHPFDTCLPSKAYLQMEASTTMIFDLLTSM